MKNMYIGTQSVLPHDHSVAPNLIICVTAFQSGQEARIVQIDFSSSYHRDVLCSVGIGSSVLFILPQVLFN